MSPLPSPRSESESTQEGTIRVLDLDDEDADAVFDALSSATTRSILAELHRDPCTPAELAERTDTTVQNAMYHLEKLEDVDLACVEDTQYSSRGRTMKVYAPAENPAVVFVGTADRKDGLLATLKRLLGAVGVVGLLAGVLRAVSNALDQVAGGQASRYPGAVAALTGAVAMLVVSFTSIGSRHRLPGPLSSPDTTPMTRKTLLIAAVVLVAVTLTPAALAYSPALLGGNYTSTAPASLTAAPADAGVPDFAGETVTLHVEGGDATVRSAYTERLTAALEARGATVERTDALRDASGPVLAVGLDDDTTATFGHSPATNFTTSFAYVESGNTTLATDALAHAVAHRGEHFTIDLNATERVAVGTFRVERYGGSDPLRTAGTDAANATVEQALQEIWT